MGYYSACETYYMSQGLGFGGGLLLDLDRQCTCIGNDGLFCFDNSSVEDRAFYKKDPETGEEDRCYLCIKTDDDDGVECKRLCSGIGEFLGYNVYCKCPFTIGLHDER